MIVLFLIIESQNHDLKPALWKIDPTTNLPERMNPLEVDKIGKKKVSGAFSKSLTHFEMWLHKIFRFI